MTSKIICLLYLVSLLPKERRYTQVRKQLGGGPRVQLINRNASSSELFTVLLTVSFQIV